MCQPDQPDQPDQPPEQDPPSSSNAATPPFPWHAGVFDAHCHPTDVMSLVDRLSEMRANVLTIMATRSQDQHLVAEVAAEHGLRGDGQDGSALKRSSGAERGAKVIPAFGWHPWFSHQLYDDSVAEPSYSPSSHNGDEDAAKKAHYQAVLSPPPNDSSFLASLPTPQPISSFIASSQANLTAHPHALVGEIGLDKAFRLPQPWDPSSEADRDAALTPGTRERRMLSPHRVRMSHQQAVLTAQLALAGREGRPVSVHGVQAHGLLFDTLAETWKGCERRVLSRREKKLAAAGVGDDSSSENEDDNDKSVPA